MHRADASACKERMRLKIHELAYLLAGILRMLGKMHGNGTTLESGCGVHNTDA